MKKILLVILILVSLFVIGCKKEVDTCGIFAKSLTPSTVTLYNYEPDTYCWLSKGSYNQWKDGELINEGICARKGKLKGQNINYFYTTVLNNLSYSKKIISPEGLILGDNTFTMRINTLEPIAGTNRTVPEYAGEVQDFKILDYAILSCNLVKQ